MNKPRKVRGSLPLKVVAFQLAWVLAAGVCACGGGAIELYAKEWNYADEGSLYDMAYSQSQELPAYLFLYLHQNALTDEGQEIYQNYCDEFSAGNTNFRYAITHESGTVLLTNSSVQPLSEADYETMGMEAVSGYELGASRLLSYYLDMDKVTDWTVREGTSQQWRQTEYASRYYYNISTVRYGSDYGFDYENDAYDAENYEDAMEFVMEVAAAEDAAAYDEEDYEDALKITVEGPSTTDATTYCYFVYTGGNLVYQIEFGLDRSFPVEDWYAQYVRNGASYQTYYHDTMPFVLGVGIACLGGFVLLLTYLTLAVGWNKAGELDIRGVSRVPIELMLVWVCLAEVLAAVIFSNVYWDDGLLPWLVYCGLAGIPGALGALTIWLVTAAQLKTRTLLRRSLIWRLLRWLWRGWNRLIGGVKRMARQWPLYDKVGIFWLIYWAAYLLYLGTVAYEGMWDYGVWGLILLGTLPLVPLVVFTCKWALDWAKLRKAVKEMVAGQLDYTIDTRGMLPDVKTHGDDLSHLSAGLSKAVEERLRSERFKTELITNVSHDLKTPLTSIINYVDLLKHLDIQDEKAREYLDVLDRKSQRLKTLTEDLVEASKAASGTIAVQLERLDVRELVEQAVAEYDERLEQAGLTTVVHTPEQPCTVMADGRHLWRILDNLLGNCTKYAMPGTRVYLDVAEEQNRCVITVKNISADPLNIPAEELLKRFVRGDSSRSTEGSGLGLSIARNLTNAQSGTFDLMVDGDLFKAIVAFPLAEPAAQPALELPTKQETAEDGAGDGTTDI